MVASSPEGSGWSNASQPLVVEAGSGTVLIPGGLLLDGQYQRHGGDLVLTGADGTKAVVKGFFDLEQPPSLVNEAGATIAPDLAASLARALGPAQYAQAQPPAFGGAPIGQIDKLQGDVYASRPDGLRRKLAAGDPVFQGEVIETGGGASIGIIFADRSTFALNENARMLLDQLVYDPGAKRGALKLSLLKGAFLFVSGEISKLQGDLQLVGGGEQDAVSMRTPVATIGVRGTAGGGNALGEGQNNSYTVFDGTIIVRTGSSFQILDQPLQTTTVFSLFAAPTVPRLASRAEILSRFGDAIRVLPPPPPPAGGDGSRSAQAGAASIVATLLASGSLEQASGDSATGAGTGGALAAANPAGETVPPPPKSPDSPAFVAPGEFIAGLAANPPAGLVAIPIAVGGSILPTWSVTSTVAAAAAPVAPPPPPAPPAPASPVVIVGTDGVDVLVGTSGPNIIIGQSGDDSITGGPADDQIFAGDGNDTVNAGGGHDLVVGGRGRDSLAGGDGTDTVSYAEATAGVTIDLGRGVAVSQLSDGFDSLSGFENVVGSSLPDVITGDGGANALLAGGGNDTLIGGGGADILDGGSGVDTVLYTNAPGPVSVDLAAGVASNDGTGASDLLVSIENVFGSPFGDTLAGDGAANVIVGGGGDDVIRGGAARDTLTGGAGSDTFDFGNLSDHVATPVNGPPTGAETVDIIADFQNGQDQFRFDGTIGLPEGSPTLGVNFSVIGTSYDGTSSGGPNDAWQNGDPSFIFDAASNRLIYDANGAGEGYTIVAQVQPGAVVAASDIKIAGGSSET